MCVYVCKIFMHFSLNPYLLGCFYILLIMNNGTNHVGVHIFFQINVLFSFNKYSTVELLGPVAELPLIFWGNFILFSK